MSPLLANRINIYESDDSSSRYVTFVAVDDEVLLVWSCGDEFTFAPDYLESIIDTVHKPIRKGSYPPGLWTVVTTGDLKYSGHKRFVTVRDNWLFIVEDAIDANDIERNADSGTDDKWPWVKFRKAAKDAIATARANTAKTD